MCIATVAERPSCTGQAGMQESLGDDCRKQKEDVKITNSYGGRSGVAEAIGVKRRSLDARKSCVARPCPVRRRRRG